MEKKLKMLFDYQHFEKTAHLARLIEETERRCTRELTDEELALVSAAGEAEISRTGINDENADN